MKLLILVPFLEADFDEISPITAHRTSNHVVQTATTDNASPSSRRKEEGDKMNNSNDN